MKNDFYVVAIGASSGGLKALTDFFDHLPFSLPIAIIIVQHLSRDHKSLLAPIIAKHTEMEVIRLEKNTELVKGKVFVMVEDTELDVSGNTLLVGKRPAGKVNKAIDRLMISLAGSFREKAIGIILSGGGNDGLEGALYIKKNGGHVLAQEPNTAEVSSMPNSIIVYDHPIATLSPAELAQKMSTICNKVNDFK